MDRHALVAVLRSERSRFVRMARSRLGSEADAEDVVQRAMTRAVERASSIQDASRARAWFYRILRRAIADHTRNRPPIERASAAKPPEPSVDGRDLVLADAPCACAVRLMRELRPTYAEVVRRIDLDAEDGAAVATSLGVHPSHLYVRLHRARKALRASVERHCGVSSVAPCLACTCGPRSRCADTRTRENRQDAGMAK